jgi:cell division ATPase FtsA
MELLDDVCHVESPFGLFGDSVSVSARLVHGSRQTYHMLINHFERTHGTPR